MPHNLNSIRTTIVQARYLLSASMSSQAYIRNQIGVSIAWRVGLMAPSSATQVATLSKEEQWQRRIVRAALCTMETFISSILGVPKMLPFDAVQMLRPEDEQEGTGAMLNDTRISAISEAIRFQQLGGFMAKIMQRRELYISNESSTVHEKQRIQLDTFVAELSAEIDSWQSSLSVPSNSIPSFDLRTLMAQLSIRLVHAATRMMLYRPYIHYLAHSSADSSFDLRGYEYGSRCINAAMEAIWVVDSLKVNNILHEAHWTAIYMLSYATIVLLYFIHSTKHQVTVAESMTAITKASTLLGFLSRYSQTAERCSVTIATVSDSLGIDL